MRGHNCDWSLICFSEVAAVYYAVERSLSGDQDVLLLNVDVAMMEELRVAPPLR